MKKINLVDYYCGAFLTRLIANKIEPMLFEAGENSRIVEFTIKSETYKVYFKYSTSRKTNEEKGKTIDKWSLTFTPIELAALKDFPEENKKTYLVLFCTDKQLKNAGIAVLEYKEARKCLGSWQNDGDADLRQRQITIRHQKHSSQFLCTGTGCTEEFGIPYDYGKRFHLSDMNIE